MKKINKIILIIVGIIMVTFPLLGFLPLGTQKYKSNGITISVPRFSIFKEECCMFNANFISLRSVESLRLEIEKELSKYEKITCNDRTYYYDNRQDFTITEYYINNGLFFNDYGIIYDKGNYCEKELTHTDLIIEIEEAKHTDLMLKQLIFPETSSYVKPLNYKLYSYGLEKVLISLNDLSSQKYSLEEALRNDLITIEDIVKKLEYGALYGNWKKEIYDDGGSILYKTFGFSLLKCNTLAGNKDYYIGNIDMEYEESFCK